MTIGQAAIIAVVGAALLLDKYWRRAAQKNSILRKRDPLELERLYQLHFKQLKFSKNEVVEALTFAERFLGEDVQRLRPTDKFSQELAHLCSGMDSDVEAMWCSLANEYGLSQAELDELVSKETTVQDFLEAHVSLSSRKSQPEKASN